MENVQALHSNDFQTQLQAATTIRKLLCKEENEPPIDIILQSGVLPTLVQFLTRIDKPQLQFESIWAITNIASGSSQHVEQIVNSGAVPILVQLLQSTNNEDVIEQAVWALGNIAGDSSVHRDYILQLGALQTILSIINCNPKLSMLRNATRTLSNLFRGKPQPLKELVMPGLPVLASLLYASDEAVICDALWALSYFTDGVMSTDRIQAVIECNAVRRLVELLLHPTTSVVVPALRTCGNIATGDDNQTQVLLNVTLLPCLCHLLSHTKTDIRKEACWIISNLLAGSKVQIQTVIDANVIPQIIKVLSNQSEDHSVKKEAIWAFNNLFSGGNNDQISYGISMGCLLPIINYLDSCNDEQVLSVILESIRTLLKTCTNYNNCVDSYIQLIEECGGLEKVRVFAEHSNQEIRNTAVDILAFCENDTEMDE